MYSELIKALRCEAMMCKPNCRLQSICDDKRGKTQQAADAIESLSTQLATVTADYEQAVEDIGKYAKHVHTCGRYLVDCVVDEHDRCFECKQWTYRRNKGNG